MVGELTPLQQQRRDSILDAAVAAFSKVRYHHVEVEAIAKEAGVGKGTIYRYFKNKHDLYTSTIEHQFKIMFEFIDTSTAETDSPMQFIKSLIDAFIMFFEKNPNAFDIVILASGTIVDEVILSIRNIRNEYYKKFLKIIQQGIDEKLFKNMNKHIILRAIDASVIYVMYDQMKTSSFTIDEIKENLYNLFLNGLLLKSE